jgi:hypothetical protein
MTTIRRIYAYLLAFFGLAMFSIAAANLAQLLVDLALQAPLASAGSYLRDTVSLYAALALVGLPAWLLHWLWIGRTARSNPQELTSTLRRLYLYAILAGAMLVMAVSIGDVLERLFETLVGARTPGTPLDTIVRPLPFTLIAFGVWWAHLRVANGDRHRVGEQGGSATLRRWYIYGSALVGLLVLLNSSQNLLESLWRGIVQPGGPAGAGLPGPVAYALVGLTLWLLHWIWLPGRLAGTDRREDGESVLRGVYLFLALAVAVVGALLGASQLLYYAVGRLLGVAEPGGIGGNILQAAAGPASFVIVYGAAWAYQRAAVRHQGATFSEAPRQAGVRRLYAYLVALLALAVLATGVAGLLWTLGDLVLGPASSLNGDTWREQISLFATLAVVGLPVWLLHWRPSPATAEEAHSLARRLYVYLSLIVAALLGIGSIAAGLYRLIGLTLGGSFDLEVVTDLAHALAVASVAALIGAYHWRLLRADAQMGHPATPDSASAVVQIVAADPAALSQALATLRSTGVQVTVLTKPPTTSPQPLGAPGNTLLTADG